MKKLSLIIGLLFCFTSLFSQSSKVLCSTLPSQSMNILTALPSNVTLKTCKGSRVQIMVTVTANCNPNILDALSKAGRYTINPKTLQLSTPLKPCFVNKVQIEESIKITILLGTDKLI